MIYRCHSSQKIETFFMEYFFPKQGIINMNLSSIPNEYYVGDLPGTLQYAKDPEELLALILPDDAEDRGFKLCEHSLENLQRVTPCTQKTVHWKILLMMMRTEEDSNKFVLKAALQDRVTGKIALLTSTNDKAHLERSGHRTVKTVDGTWFVGHFRMCAPVLFWRELKNRLLYSI